MRTRHVVGIVVLVAVFATSVLADDAEDLLRADVKAARQSSMMSSQSAAGEAEQSHRYKIGVGVYGAYEPSIFPTETWVDIACFAAPGLDYPGTFGLMYVDIRIYNNGVLVYDSTSTGADRGMGAALLRRRLQGSLRAA